MLGRRAGGHFPADRHAVARPRDARAAPGRARVSSQRARRGRGARVRLTCPLANGFQQLHELMPDRVDPREQENALL